MIKRTILVVEDERIIARDIAMQLCDLGYEPLGPADTGEQAIEMAGQLRPDLVLMDVHLGSAMDGIEAAQAIRTQFDIPTVFLSAFFVMRIAQEPNSQSPLAIWQSHSKTMSCARSSRRHSKTADHAVGCEF